MPPKLVYGRKKAPVRQGVGFDEFIEGMKEEARKAENVDDDLEGLVGGLRGLDVRDENKENEGLERGSSEKEIKEKTKENEKAKKNEKNENEGPKKKTDDHENEAIEKKPEKKEKVFKPSKESQKDKRKRQKKPSPQQLPTPETTPEPQNIHSAYVSQLLPLSFTPQILPFDQWSTSLTPHFTITKIAEASFSEVYRLTSASRTSTPHQASVLKLIPLKIPSTAPLPSTLSTRPARDRTAQLAKEQTARDESNEWKSAPEAVLSEVTLLQNLTPIPGFTTFRDLTILSGRPSSSFCTAWKAWNAARPRGKKSYFPDPSRKTSYEDGQLWAVLEMQDAGTDVESLLEGGGLKSVWEVWDVFWGVCLSVGKAEGVCGFEHRDLHAGNVCVLFPERHEGTDGEGGGKEEGKEGRKRVKVKNPLKKKFGFTGAETTVIDYTLSRADVLSSSISTGSGNAEGEGGRVAYLDLDEDPALWEGDADEEYQYEIYRYMRSVVVNGDPLGFVHPSQESSISPSTSTSQEKEKEEKAKSNTHICFDDDDSSATKCQEEKQGCKLDNKEKDSIREGEEECIWRSFHPKTNLLWAHFLLHKLLANLPPPSTLSLRDIMADIDTSPSTSSSSSNPSQQPQAGDVDEGVIEVLDPSQVRKKAIKLYKILEKVRDLLCPVALGKEDALGSVRELVVRGIEGRWLRVGDVEG